MPEEKNKILELFRKNPDESLSTSYIARKIYLGEYEEILEVLSGQFATEEERKEAGRKKSKIHRRILHHLNNMVEESLLKVVKRGKNGEKYFEPNIEPGEEIVFENVKKKKIEISKPVLPSLPIENYETKKIVKRYKGDKWLTKLDSVMMESRKFDKKDIYRVMSTTLDSIKDVLGLNSFESVISDLSTDELIKLVKRLSRDLRDFNKTASFIIDFARVGSKEREKLSRLLRELDSLGRINIILEVDSKDLKEQKKFLEDLIPTLAKHEIYFRNKNISNVPYLMGETGPYTFEERKWKKHKEKSERAKALCCSQSTIFIDFKKLFQGGNGIERSKFNDLIEKSYRSLFIGNNLQRRKKHELFQNMLDINEEEDRKEFFIYGRNYIRLWCAETIYSNFDESTALKLLKDLKRDTDEFCVAESTIYKSCGMPIEFKVAFSPGKGPYLNKNLSRNNFKKITVESTQELYSDDFNEQISPKDSLSSVYDGGNLVEISRKGDYSNSDIAQEISIILNSKGFEFFRYKLGESTGKDTNIQRFFG